MTRQPAPKPVLFVTGVLLVALALVLTWALSVAIADAAPDHGIACWVPQPATFVPLDPTAEAWPYAVPRDSYAAWLASSVRQRPRDGRWEVIVRGAARDLPQCVNVLPDSPQGLWIASPDVADVQAYLTRTALGAP